MEDHDGGIGEGGYEFRGVEGLGGVVVRVFDVAADVVCEFA